MLHTTVTIGVGEPEFQPDAHLSGDIPIIEFRRLGIDSTDHAVATTANIALHFDGAADQAAWLRLLSAACDDLAEQVDLAGNPGTVLADRHIAEAKAATGFGAA